MSNLSALYRHLRRHSLRPARHCSAYRLVTAFASMLLLSASGIATAGTALDGDTPWLQQLLSRSDAAHLLGRTGFSADLAGYRALQGKTRAEAIDWIIAPLQHGEPLAMPGWTNRPAPRFWTRRSLEGSERQRFDQARDRELVNLRQWWVNTMLDSPHPQVERLVLFWHDHFATSYHGLNRHSILLARQQAVFRSHGMGSWRELLKAMIRDSALLLYLDNQSNRKGSPNENLARELLELFTLGEGNYSELDVKEAARALTGYGFSPTHDLQFRFHSYRHDRGDKQIFSDTGKHDGDALIDLILQQDAAARHLATRFWHAFIADHETDAQFAESTARLFRNSDYDLAVLYRAVLESKAFWHPEHRLALIRSPVSLLIGTARLLDYPRAARQQIPALLSLSGMQLFAPPNVAGWTEGAAYIAPGRLLNRLLALGTLADVSVPAAADSVKLTIANLHEDAGPSMATAMSMENDPAAASAGLQLRLAAENYLGEVAYQVHLRNRSTLLWSSPVQTVQAGIDTRSFGTGNPPDMLPWQQVSFSVPSQAVAAASDIAVAFLNDAAGPDGDRNLYIDGLHLAGHWYAAASGTQNSSCPPAKQSHAGRLYCQGELVIPVKSQGQRSSDTAEQPDYSASDARLYWINIRKKRFSLSIALENLKTPGRFFHTLSLTLVSDHPEHLDMRLESSGCWPECLLAWPACSWQDELAAANTTVSFPLNRVPDQSQRCHYDSLLAHDRQLVDVLGNSVAALIAHVAANTNIDRQQKKLQQWRKRLKRITLQPAVPPASPKSLLIDTAFVKTYQPPAALSAAAPRYRTLHQLQESLRRSGIATEDYLSGFAFSAVEQAARNAAQESSLSHLLKEIIEHPVYQLH